MIIIDARAIESKSPGEINRLISEHLPSKVLVAGADLLNKNVRSSLTDAGVSLIDHKSPFVVMAAAMKKHGIEVKRVLSEDPLTLSFFSFGSDKFRVESPESRKAFTAKDVEKELMVPPSKVVELIHIIGHRGSNIPSWLPTGVEEAARWIRQSGSIKRLAEDENSPARAHSSFERRLNRAKEALERQRKLRQSIQDFDIDKVIDEEVVEQISAPQDDLNAPKEKGFSIDNLKDLITSAQKDEPLAIFVKETRNLSFLSGRSGRLEAVISTPSGESCVLSNGMPDDEMRNAWNLIGEAIENETVICTNDAKSLYKAAFHTGSERPEYSEMKNVHDVSVMAFALDNRNQKHNLHKLHQKYSTDRLSDPAKALASLFGRLQYHFSKPDNSKNHEAYLSLEQPLCAVLARMELQGLPLNGKKINDFTSELRKKRNIVLSNIKKDAFVGFSPDKSEDVARMLFEHLKLPIIEKTPKGAPSTQDSVLEKLSDRHPFVQNLREYRKINWMMNNGAINFEAHRNPYSGKIHATFEQTNSQNGRLQTTDPNTQGIPSKAEASASLREGFEPDKKQVFVTLDYKQAETLVLASLSGCSKLQNLILSGQDVHKATAAEIFDCPLEEVTAEQRESAKAINFGIVYGMSEYGISAKLGMSLSESRRMIDRYFDTYPTVKGYIDALKEGVAECGYVMTANQRRIYIEGSQDASDKKAQSSALRSAINAPMQGTTSDLIKKAMIDLSNELFKKNIKAEICSQIHDELIVQCPIEDALQVKQVAEDIMTRSSMLKIAPSVDVDIKKSLSSNDIIDPKILAKRNFDHSTASIGFG